MSEYRSFVESNRQESLDELIELLKIPSVSTDEERRGDIARCAERVAARMRRAGLEAEVIGTAGHPIVYGERCPHPRRPTLLVYGHYDVQPPDPIELWRSGPFEPTVEGEYLVARGASDDKGQFLALLEGVAACHQVRGELPVNVKLLIEGEEEIGSPNLTPFIRAEKERLAADAVLIADCSQFGPDQPAITYGLKGLVYLELIVRGPAKDLHSGSYGGAVANPANVLARMLAACQEPFGKVAIPGFYDDVKPLEEWEREEFARLGFDEEGFRRETGAPRLWGEEGYTTLERKWARPTFDVNGLLSGFTAEGAKTVLPAEARAKFSMRLVPDQDPDRISELAGEFLRDIAPATVEIEIQNHHGARAVLVPRDAPGMAAAARALEQAFGRAPVWIREGGSIPVVNTFQEELGAGCLLVGLGLPDDGAHSPNERMRIVDFYRGMEMMAAFLDELAAG